MVAEPPIDKASFNRAHLLQQCLGRDTVMCGGP